MDHDEQMEASTSPQPAPGAFALGEIHGRELPLDGRGLTRLALMVGVVFDRMTAADDQQRDRTE